MSVSCAETTNPPFERAISFEGRVLCMRERRGLIEEDGRNEQLATSSPLRGASPVAQSSSLALPCQILVSLPASGALTPSALCPLGEVDLFKFNLNKSSPPMADPVARYASNRPFRLPSCASRRSQRAALFFSITGQQAKGKPTNALASP